MDATDESFEQASYWCTRATSEVLGSAVLGSYDGFDAWMLHAGTLHAQHDQVLVSLHESLHHQLQYGTPWGLVAKFAADLARAGVEPERLTRLFRFCKASARLVHETFATALSVGDDPDARALLDANVDYQSYLDLGMRLTGGLDWAEGRFLVEVLLRQCMSPASLLPLAEVGLHRLRIADLDLKDSRPDARLETVLSLQLPALRPVGLREDATPDELGHFFDEVAMALTERGVPTLRTVAVRGVMDALFEEVAALSPVVGARIEVVTSRAPRLELLEEFQRERITLREAGPLPLEIVPAAEVDARATDFARADDRLGTHVLLVWARADLLARQFARPNALDGHEGFALALQAAGHDVDGHAVVRLGLLGTDNPAEAARRFALPFVFLTTAASLVDAPDHARSDSIDTIFAVVDLPIVGHLTTTFERGATVTWTRTAVAGEPALHVFAFTVSALPGVVWLHLTSEVGRRYLAWWLGSLDPRVAERRPEAFSQLLPEIDAAVLEVVSAWWVIDQQGGRTHG